MRKERKFERKPDKRIGSYAAKQEKWYEKNRNELVKNYRKQYLVISGKEVIYSSFNEQDAFEKGKHAAGSGRFIVRYCSI